MSKSDEMRRLIDLANGNSKPPVMEDTDLGSPTANFARWGKVNENQMPQTAREARKIDKGFYADEEDGDWYVFGDETGFAYSQHRNEKEAQEAAEERNSRLKEGREDAPFRKYKKTEEESYKEGFECGLTWKDKDNWIPGGPHVSQIRYSDRDPEWIAYCKQTEINNRAWRQGWADARAQKQNGLTIDEDEGGMSMVGEDESDWRSNAGDTRGSKKLAALRAQGFKAHHDGVKWWHNPHKSGSLEAGAWDAGHTKARLGGELDEDEGGMSMVGEDMLDRPEVLDEANSVMHLMRPRGGSECGAPCDEDNCSAEINDVTCPKCLKGHDDYMKQFDFSDDGEIDEDAESYLDRMYDAHLKAESGFNYHTNKALEEAVESDTITGPSYWASYLINGDDSGLSPEEKAQCDAWQKSIEPWYVVGMEDDTERFTWQYRLHGGETAGGSVVDYIVHKDGSSDTEMPSNELDEAEDELIPEEPQSYTAYVWAQGTENNSYWNPIKGTEAPSKEACEARLAEYSETRNPADPRRWLRTRKVTIYPTPTHAVGKYL
jgi:hypothetical protein